MTSRRVKELRTPGESMTHEELVMNIAHAAQALGFKVAGFRCVRVQRRNGQVYYETPVRFDGTGWPDLILLHKASTRRLAVEVKVKKDFLKPEQIDWLEVMDSCGFECYEWREGDWLDGSILKVLGGECEKK